MQSAIKANNIPYYQYILLYTNHALAISKNAKSIICDQLGKYFQWKEESIRPLNIYLDRIINYVTLDNGI